MLRDRSKVEARLRTSSRSAVRDATMCITPRTWLRVAAAREVDAVVATDG